MTLKPFPLAIVAGTLAFFLAAAGQARAQAAPDAQTAFAERSALLAADSRCQLLRAEERAAIVAAAAQARGALLRGGWTGTRVDALRSRATAAGQARACDDPALRQSAAQAQAGYEGWSRMTQMRFPGTHSAWSARRVPDAQGFMLRQEGRGGTVLGVRYTENGPVATLTAPLAAQSPAPGFGAISFRDSARAPSSLADVPGRGTTLAALVAPPAMARVVFATQLSVETDEEGRRFAVVTFPQSAFAAIAGLDPREAIEVRLGREPGVRGVSLVFEVGDLAAAQAFLLARPVADS
ncbi:MAG: hypothetical protein ACOYKM_04795 [Caulobacterales bacterium]|jgi:hypothetical protein